MREVGGRIVAAVVDDYHRRLEALLDVAPDFSAASGVEMKVFSLHWLADSVVYCHRKSVGEEVVHSWPGTGRKQIRVGPASPGAA